MNAPRNRGTFLLALALAGVLHCPAGLSSQAAAPESAGKRADFRGVRPPADVQHIADWAVHSGDHKGLPFIIVDKVHAKAMAFDRGGKFLRAAPVLIGMGVGDTFEPGVINLEMHQTKPSQRITPAGRYFAEEDRNLAGERVLWVDYDTGIALHKLSAKKTRQRRHERMASPDPADHRITYGCINVPAAFYDQVVPQFRAKGGIVYVLPDSAPAKAVFNSYEVPARRLSSAEHAAPGIDSLPTQRF